MGNLASTNNIFMKVARIHPKVYSYDPVRKAMSMSTLTASKALVEGGEGSRRWWTTEPSTVDRRRSAYLINHANATEWRWPF